MIDALATGADIRLRSKAEFVVQVNANTHIQAYANGGTSLSQAGSKKLETMSSGARVTGTLDVTSGITLENIIKHTKSVKKGIKKSLLVVDMPKGSYNNKSLALKNAKIVIYLSCLNH